MSTALDRSHRARQLVLRQQTGNQLGRLLASLPSFDQAGVEAYHEPALVAVTAGQRAAATTAAGYAGLRVPRPRPRRPVDVDAALARSGLLVTPDSPSVVAPAVHGMALVSQGLTFAAALQAAQSMAYALSSMDMQSALGVGLEEGTSAAGGRITGYRKELSPDACAMCQESDGVIYESADDVPFHERDTCSVAPVYGE